MFGTHLSAKPRVTASVPFIHVSAFIHWRISSIEDFDRSEYNLHIVSLMASNSETSSS